MRPATQADWPGIRDRLMRAPHRAMFTLSNVARHGLNGAEPYAVRIWASDDFEDVLALTNNGIVMPLLPNGEAAAADIFAGKALSGFNGPAEFCRPLMRRMKLDAAPATIDRDEPQFLLDLADLVVPDGPGAIVPLERAAREVVLDWMEAYEIEAIGTPAAQAAAEAAADPARYVAADSHRVLVHAGTARSMTGFNAAIPEMVQVGGVYTPPERRGRGHAARAVALHLAEARSRGTVRATLFSANPLAQRAYRAVGFERCGLWTLALFRTPQEAGQ